MDRLTQLVNDWLSGSDRKELLSLRLVQSVLCGYAKELEPSLLHSGHEEGAAAYVENRVPSGYSRS